VPTGGDPAIRNPAVKGLPNLPPGHERLPHFGQGMARQGQYRPATGAEATPRRPLSSEGPVATARTGIEVHSTGKVVVAVLISVALAPATVLAAIIDFSSGFPSNPQGRKYGQPSLSPRSRDFR